jgi:hypothetical protein
MSQSFARQLVAYVVAIMLLFAVFLMLAVLAVPPAHAQQPVTSNLVSGAGSTTGTGATTIIAAPTTTRRIYVTAVQCGRTDAGTTGIYVTLNDNASTIIVVPNTAGGGGNNMPFPSPLTVPAATALTFTSSGPGVSTLYCNAQGFTGN